MKPIVQLLYDSIYPHLDVNPHYREAERSWEALAKSMTPEDVDTVSLLNYEWGFICFTAGLTFSKRLERELAEY